MKKKKQPTLSALEEKLDRLFSEYIRRRDAEFTMLREAASSKVDAWQTFSANHRKGI